jgi:PEP-CTERM motif
MHKALALVVLLITPAIVFADGTVQFENLFPPFYLVKQWTTTANSTLIDVPSGYVQLIAGAKGTPLPHPLGTLTTSGFLPNYASVSGFLTANPGWGAVATTQIDSGGFEGFNVTINNIAAGAQADYLVIGWTGSFSSYDLAYTAATTHQADSFLGVSATATTKTGNPLTYPPGNPVSLSWTFLGMTLGPALIPEPTTFALAGLGAAALMIVRRRM